MAHGLIGGANLHGALQLVKIGKMVKPAVSSIYGVNLVGADAGNGKTSRAIKWRTNWRYKPARALKLAKMVNQRTHWPMG